MKRYKVETQREGSVKYFFIRDMESLEIVLLPSKYLMHQVRANRSPNTIRRNAFALAYYWEYLLENEKKAEDIYAMGEKDRNQDHPTHASEILCKYEVGSRLAAGNEQSGIRA